MLNRKSSFLVQILVRKKDCSIIFNTFFFFLMIRRPPRPPLFPNTTLFRPPGPPPNEPASADPQRIPDPGPTTALTRRPRSRLPSTPRVRPEHPTHTAQHRQSDAANNHRDPPDHTASRPRRTPSTIIHANGHQRTRTRLFWA